MLPTLSRRSRSIRPIQQPQFLDLVSGRALLQVPSRFADMSNIIKARSGRANAVARLQDRAQEIAGRLRLHLHECFRRPTSAPEHSQASRHPARHSESLDPAGQVV